MYYFTSITIYYFFKNTSKKMFIDNGNCLTSIAFAPVFSVRRKRQSFEADFVCISRLVLTIFAFKYATLSLSNNKSVLKSAFIFTSFKLQVRVRPNRNFHFSDRALGVAFIQRQEHGTNSTIFWVFSTGYEQEPGNRTPYSQPCYIYIKMLFIYRQL
jgi:hypothetical protein